MSLEPILVVDDEAQNLAAMRQVLSDHYPLVFAKEGCAALEAVQRFSPRLILLDIEMPGIDGFEVCRRLKADPATEHIPVIFVTSLSQVGDEARGFEVGAVDYITKPISPPIVRARVRTHLSLVNVKRLEQSHRSAITMLGKAGHYNDNDTGVHIWRMAAYARALASACGWSEEACIHLETAAPMHDTGKIGVPGELLRKSGPLTPDEWVLMRAHTTIGYSILSQSSAPLFKLAATIALYHHERWDGSGYPEGRSGSDIPEAARIVAVADVFDALTMARPYKRAWSLDEAAAKIRAESGSHFDPQMVAHFETILPQLFEINTYWDERAQDDPFAPQPFEGAADPA